MKTEDLILENQALIKYIIKNMGLEQNFDEYFSIGQIGLIKASKKFDESRGIKFSTFAVKCIEQEILKQINYEHTNKRKHNYFYISLDTILEGDNKGTPLYEIIDSGTNIERDLIKKEKINLLNTIIAILEPKDRFMLEHYFGLLGKEKMTQKKIAEVLRVKDRYVTHRIKRAMKIIKKIMEDKYGE